MFQSSAVSNSTMKKRRLLGKRTNYAFNIDQMNVGDANNQTNGGSEAEMGRAAWIGQVKYNYANKYYAEGSIRYDSSDRFAPETLGDILQRFPRLGSDRRSIHAVLSRKKYPKHPETPCFLR